LAKISLEKNEFEDLRNELEDSKNSTKNSKKGKEQLFNIFCGKNKLFLFLKWQNLTENHLVANQNKVKNEVKIQIEAQIGKEKGNKINKSTSNSIQKAVQSFFHFFHGLKLLKVTSNPHEAKSKLKAQKCVKKSGSRKQRPTLNLIRKRIKLFFHSFHVKLQLSLNQNNSKHWLEQKLLTSGDIETNPGPKGKLRLFTYNIRGCATYDKLKRIINYCYGRAKKTDRLFFSLQETHIKNDKLLKCLWRDLFVLSPSLNNARGTLLLCSGGAFEEILYRHGSSDGRSAWVIGKQNGNTDLVVSIYAPNSGKNLEFYKQFFTKVRNLVDQHSVDNIFIMGDLNIVLSGGCCTNRTTTKCEKKMKEFIESELSELNLCNLSQNPGEHTWTRGTTFSTLDYILGPCSSVNLNIQSKTMWGIDKSDHAAVCVDIEFELDKGPGMFRPNLTFLEYPDYVHDFVESLNQRMSEVGDHFNPHEKLEFCKVMLRTLMVEQSKKFSSKIASQYVDVSSELDKLHKLKLKKATDPTYNRFVEMDDIENDIASLELELDNLLTIKTKMLASRSRIKWLEFGEKSNKYFLNINKSAYNKSYFKSFVSEGVEKFNIKDKVDTAYDFYSDLYSCSPVLDPAEFLNLIHVNPIASENCLDAPLESDELLKILKKCGDTASGPDGISYKIIKIIWPLYSRILIDSWNYSIYKGCLPQSHNEAVIILLEKKGKDKRFIGNLRPISLSNCDIKIITKALTKRMNQYLPNMLDPQQTAYIPGRQVHDNLRALSLIKDVCVNKNIDAYLVSLDAKKAFDSVDHKFIFKVLEKYGVNQSFINVVKLLYKDLSSRVQINGYLSKSFPILRGVKQGDALSCVIFILCMDVLIKLVNKNPKIPRIDIPLGNILFPKTFAYADDIAIVTSTKAGVVEALKQYETFSLHSGLFLNVEKTEILNLKDYNPNTQFIIESFGASHTIKLVDTIKICGKSFSNSRQIELKCNIEDKIANLVKMLKSWSRRSLSIYGRNLILKTFGLSQITYMLQNTAFPNDKLIEIEKICFNFLWNKKADKTKAFERISRVKLKQDKDCGGINAPDIASFDSAMKVSQVFRTLNSDLEQGHVIHALQKYILRIDNNTMLDLPRLNEPFTDVYCMSKRVLLKNLVSEICNVGDLRLDRRYYDLLANENCFNFFNEFGPKFCLPFIKQMSHTLGLVTLKDFITEFKFPRSDRISENLNLIFANPHPSLDILLKRKQCFHDVTFSDGFFFQTNLFCKALEFSTKKIKIKLLDCKTTATFEPIYDFRMLQKIQHPREREIIFFSLHNVLLTNEKLFKLNLSESDQCPMCMCVQDQSHIFETCSNANYAKEVIDETILSNPSVPTQILTSIRALVKRSLYLKRNDPVNKQFFRSIITQRISDFEAIEQHKIKNKKIKAFLAIRNA